MYKFSREKFHNYGFIKGRDDEKVNKFKELSYGFIDHNTDLLFMRFMFLPMKSQTNEHKIDQKIFLA